MRAVHPWEHTFVTSQEHAWARFRRALDTGNATIALSAAADLPHVGLAEAIELVLLLAKDGGPRFQRAALRWQGRYCREVRDVSTDEAVAVLTLLLMLEGPRVTFAAQALGDLIYRRETKAVCEALIAASRPSS